MAKGVPVSGWFKDLVPDRYDSHRILSSGMKGPARMV